MIEQNTFTIIFGIFLFLTCRDMFIGKSHGSDHGTPEIVSTISPNDLRGHSHLSGDSPHIASFHSIPTVKIQYCHSCGYRQAFDEISKLLAANFPDIKIEGEYHQPNFLRAQIVNLIFLTKIALLIMIYMDINPFNYLQMATPPIWTHIMSSKVPSSLIILFVTNSIESNMMSTGAFEIFYNDIPIWSKMTTGRMPSGSELLQQIGSQYNLGAKSKIGEFLAH